jgi:F420-non-reducing hydrogenase iron-sulfur subunit
MVIETRPGLSTGIIPGVKSTKLQITVFHCFNVLNNLPSTENEEYDIRSIKMPCSSLTREVVLLRAFESGADAVVVLVCPQGACRHIDGNLRAAKRVARMKKLLDEIGLDGRRLNLFNIPHNDLSAIDHIIDRTISDLALLGPNPATSVSNSIRLSPCERIKVRGQ